MRLKLLVVSLTLLNVLQANEELLLNQLKHLTPNQQYILVETFQKAKPFDYQYTLTAIAWQESDFGVNLLNLKGTACGTFGITPKSALSRLGKANSNWNRSKICQRLILDYDFGFSHSLAELKFWENYWKSKGVNKVWSKTVASYYAGSNWRKGWKYLRDIKERIRVLKLFLKGKQ